MQVLLQTRRLTWRILVEELLNVQVKVSEQRPRHFGTWREGRRDDLVCNFVWGVTAEKAPTGVLGCACVRAHV